MKKILLAVFLLINHTISFCQSVAIIPEPVSIKKNEGSFTFKENISIFAKDIIALSQTISFLKERFTQATFNNVSTSNTSIGGDIRLVLNEKNDIALGEEGYHLISTNEGVTINANKPTGIFYGAQTLIQLLPAAIESSTKVENTAWTIPNVDIVDYPRFKWRGLMFDVSRHFFTKAEVKTFIDQMVRYKYNVFHWHLTDDEGWRIEIKSLPKLTEVGAWNVKKVGYFGTFKKPADNEPRDYGGFYTQEDIKEIVQYAKDRFVNVLPEIDVPGHSLAAIASYPELSCTKATTKYQVRSGEEIMDWSHGAPPTALLDNNLCPANENVYIFLDKVFTEVATLFPFDYIHVGGDECAQNFWKKSDAIKALMKKEGLKTIPQVQGYFEKRLQKIIASKGKKFLGWDEILEGGLAPDAAVMSWRGDKGGIEAAKLKHNVVMSPTTHCYLDYMQSDVVMEPKIYESLRLNKTYKFDPLPAGVDAQYILGGQANLWTEQVYNMRHMQYMLWPRAFAISECVWSQKENKNWDSFVTKVEQHFKRYDAAEIKYAPSMYDPIFTAKKDKAGVLNIDLATEIKGLDIYYSFDNSFPDRFYPKYSQTLIAPSDAVMLKVITYKGKDVVGRMLFMPIAELKKRVGDR
jgi:hexosaminidase